MPRRIDIELTSDTGDGSFTWRVAGAKQPKGTVDAGLVPAGSGVGAVLRAELESGLDGVEIIALAPRLEKTDSVDANRIQITGVARRGPDVLVTYAGGGRRRRPDDDDDDSSRPGGRGRTDRGPRRGGAPGSRPERGDRGPRGERTGGDRQGSVESRTEGSESTAGGDATRAGGASRPRRAEGGSGPRRSDGPPARRERRPIVSTTHRNAMLATLGPQELPVAEQLLRGGMPAVRQAIAEQNAKRVGGSAPTNADAVLAIAEQLLAKVNLAGWKDRAAAAQMAGKDFRLRELRAVVTASRTVTLDDDARVLAKTLQESLDQRVRALQDEWLARLGKALDDENVHEALATANRPPEAAIRLPAELAVRLAAVAGAAMRATSEPGDWIVVLSEVVESPVRRTVKPQGIPDDPEAQDAARRAAGSVPELARLLGLPIPPPPRPRRPLMSGPRAVSTGGGARAGGR